MLPCINTDPATTILVDLIFWDLITNKLGIQKCGGRLLSEAGKQVRLSLLETLKAARASGGKAFIFHPRTSLSALIFTTIERQVQRPLLAVVDGDKNLNSRIALLLSM